MIIFSTLITAQWWPRLLEKVTNHASWLCYGFLPSGLSWACFTVWHTFYLSLFSSLLYLSQLQFQKFQTLCISSSSEGCSCLFHASGLQSHPLLREMKFSVNSNFLTLLGLGSFCLLTPILPEAPQVKGPTQFSLVLAVFPNNKPASESSRVRCPTVRPFCWWHPHSFSFEPDHDIAQGRNSFLPSGGSTFCVQQCDLP